MSPTEINSVVIPAIFAAAVAVTVLITWASDEHVRQKLGLLLLFAWATSNIAVAALGYERAPLIIPTIDAIAATLIALVGILNRSQLALQIFFIYVLVGATWVISYLNHAEGSYNCYAICNALFACQLIILGASSARLAVRRWAAWGRQRFRHHPSRG